MLVALHHLTLYNFWVHGIDSLLMIYNLSPFRGTNRISQSYKKSEKVCFKALFKFYRFHWRFSFVFNLFFGLKFLGRQFFTAQDIRLIENYFSTNILMRRCPNKSEVDGFLNKHPIRSPKDWLKIKFCVRNIYVVSTIFVLRCVIVKCEVVVAYPSQCWFFPSHAFSLGKTYFAVSGGPQNGLKTALSIP